MHLSLKTFLGIVSSMGGACAIGVPVFLFSGGSSSYHNDKNVGGTQASLNVGQLVGGGQRRQEIVLVKCSSLDNTANFLVDFGAPGASFCWKVRDLERELELDREAIIDYSLTGLFKKMWRESHKNWNSEGHSDWKVVCIQERKGWIAVHSENGEYLGYCSSSRTEADIKETIFLEINKQDGKKAKINICKSDCWKNVDGQDNIKNLSVKENQSWREVEFYGDLEKIKK